MNDFPAIVEDAFARGTCRLLVLSKKRSDSAAPVEKLSVRPVTVQGAQRFQFAWRADGKETHENLSPAGAFARFRDYFGPVFRHCHLYTDRADYTARFASGRRIKVKERPPTKAPPETAHDRRKNYMLPEGEPCAFLTEIGVMTAEGKVRAARQAKFRQINRFLELINDVVPRLPDDGPLQVVDFGCGKSYLTFALHHLLTEVHHREVRIVGLDRDEGVVRTCSEIAERLGCRGLDFRVGNIAAHAPEGPVHLVVSLHACDTATDDALAQAVYREADVILAVPCCQHELAGKIHSDPLSPLLEHGLFNERFAALATDALRAKALELCGYETQVVEFVETEHTPKNVLIRAVRGPESRPVSETKLRDYRTFKESLGLERIYLDNVLAGSFRVSSG